MKLFRLIFFILISCLTFFARINDLLTEEDLPVFLNEAKASIAFGETIGVDEPYASIRSFNASLYENHLIFIDGSIHHLRHGENGVSIGTGVRFGDGTRGVGANIYYDWRHIHSHSQNQVSFGLEGWLCPWEMRLNIYIPLQNYTKGDRLFCNYEGDYFLKSYDNYYSCRIASLLFGRQFYLPNCFIQDLSYAFLIGPYWISHHREKSNYGALLELDLFLGKLLSFKLRTSIDPIFNTAVQGILSIQIPLYCSARSCCKSISSFYRSPERLDLVPVDKINFCNYNW